MQSEDEQLFDLCRKVSQEDDSKKLDNLIRELNHELDHQHAKKQPASVQSQEDIKPASHR